MSVNSLNKERFNIQGKDITLYKSDDYNVPLIIFNTYEGDGEEVYNILNETESINCNLLVVGNLKWNHDISPWPVPAIYPKEEPFGGGADEYLKLLKDKILPMAIEKINGEPKFTGIAGYSLAGLFAVYAMYNTDIFDRVASVSSSFWFPDFKDYCLSNELKKNPSKIYFSIGDKEAKTRNHILKTVYDNTVDLVEHFKSLGIEVIFELNQGNHFKDEVLRSVNGIKAILE